MSELWTPGPWTVSDRWDEVYGPLIEGDGHNQVAAVAPRGSFNVAIEPRAEANTRLIALAPEMADLLGVFERYTPTMMRVYGNHFPSLGRPLDDAHQLLVRARGETA